MIIVSRAAKQSKHVTAGHPLQLRLSEWSELSARLLAPLNIRFPIWSGVPFLTKPLILSTESAIAKLWPWAAPETQHRTSKRMQIKDVVATDAWDQDWAAACCDEPRVRYVVTKQSCGIAEKAKRRQSAGIIDLVVCITDREVRSLDEGHCCDLCPHIECPLVKRIGAPLTILLATRRTRALNVAFSKELNEILSISFCPLHSRKSIPRQSVRRKKDILHMRTA